MSRGRSSNCRPVRVEVVHCVRTGQAWQAVVGNRTTMPLRPWMRHGDQIVEVTFCGQMTCWWSQSIRTAARGEPSAGLGLGGTVGVERADHSDLVLAHRIDQQFGGGVAAIDHLLARA
jgi:hypothetical protein